MKKTITNCWYEYYKRDSEKICLCDKSAKYSRYDVEIISGKIYCYLRSKDIKKGDFVLIDLPRTARTYIAMLGVLKTGAAYITIESSLAAERKKYIKNDLNVSLVLNQEL